MNQQLVIRKATEDDFEKLHTLFVEFSHFEKHPEKMVNTVERMKAEQAFFHGWLVETSDTGVTVGYTVCFFAYYTWTGKAMYIDDLYIKPEFRGAGVGTELINTVITYAKEVGCHKVRWQVSGWNTPAVAFYKKLGVEIDDVQRNCDLML